MGAIKEAQPSSHHGGENLRSTHRLHYRPHVKWSYYSLIGLAGLLGSLSLIGALGLLLMGAVKGAIFFSVIGSFIPTLLYLEARYLIKPLAFSFVDVFEDHIKLDRLGKLETLHFNDIEHVTFSSIPMVGGWYKIKTKNGKARRFTVVLENSHLVLDAINQTHPNLIDQRKLSEYRRTAVYSSESWDRVYSKLSNWPMVAAKYLALPILLAACFFISRGWSFKSGFMSAVALNYFWGLAVYTAEEAFIGWETRRAMLNNHPSQKIGTEFVARSQKTASLIYLIGFTLACVLTML